MDARFSDEALAFLHSMAQNAAFQANTLEVATMRQSIEDLHEKANVKLSGTFKGILEERVLKTIATEIPITIYTPVDVNKDKLGIFFHGGGWVIGSRKSHQVIVNSLADATKTTWISVEYRLGPEHKYPIWLDDAGDVTQYIIQNKTSFGVDPTAKIGVAGDSAGGTISASLGRTVKGIDFHIIVYGGLDFLRQTASNDEFKREIYVLTPELMDWFHSNAFSSAEDYKDPRVSALLNTSFEGVPPCLFIVAELDPLRDANLEYQKLLEKAGIPTKLVVIKGAVHGFFSVPGILPKACAESINAIQEFMESI